MENRKHTFHIDSHFVEVTPRTLKLPVAFGFDQIQLKYCKIFTKWTTITMSHYEDDWGTHYAYYDSFVEAGPKSNFSPFLTAK